jgi:hypothetical protein
MYNLKMGLQECIDGMGTIPESTERFLDGLNWSEPDEHTTQWVALFLSFKFKKVLERVLHTRVAYRGIDKGLLHETRITAKYIYHFTVTNEDTHEICIHRTQFKEVKSNER